MTDYEDNNLVIIIKITTFVFLILLTVGAFWASNLKLYAELDAVILLLIFYTLLLVLPISDFELSPTGLKGKIVRKLNKLSNENQVKIISVDSAAQIEKDLSDNSISPSDADLVFMKLMLEIQQTLDKIASSVGIKTRKNSFGYLVRELQLNGVIKERWLLNSLYFLRDNRNEVLHLGNRRDVTQKAINVGKSVLAELLEIKKKYEKER
jgi:hypothetical protein